MRIRRSLRRIVANLVDAHSEEQQCVVLLSIECDLARDLGALGQCERVIGVCYIVVQRFADEEVEQQSIFVRKAVCISGRCSRLCSWCSLGCWRACRSSCRSIARAVFSLAQISSGLAAIVDEYEVGSEEEENIRFEF